MKTHATLALFLLALTACGAPASTDIALEILERGDAAIGNGVVLKTSPSLKSGSLHQASEIWLRDGWVRVDSNECKSIVPKNWESSVAFTFTIAITDKEGTLLYTSLLCATQFDNPKRIAAIGVAKTPRKADPIKP
jgi:uncharacterized membrane protein